MSWFALTDEERTEWRQHPTTQAFFASIRDQIQDAKDEAVSALQGDEDVHTLAARRIAGLVQGLEAAIKTMETNE